MISLTSPTVIHNGKVEHSEPASSQYEQRIRVLEHYVQLLIVRTSMGDYWAEGLHDVANLLAALPFPTGEFSSVKRHLQNAVDYCQQEEFGAATFELRVVRGHLQRL